MLQFAFGVVGALFSVVAAMDPASAQLANDSAPFGTPPSVASFLVLALAFMLPAAAGTMLWRRASRSARAGRT